MHQDRLDIARLLLVPLACACLVGALLWPNWREEVYAQTYYLNKQSLKNAETELNYIAAGGAIVAPVCLGIPVVGQCAAIGVGIVSGVMWLSAVALGDLADDPPDPNFIGIAEPIVPSIPLFTVNTEQTRGEADAWNDLFRNQAEALTLRGALLTSLERAQGAELAGDTFW